VLKQFVTEKYTVEWKAGGFLAIQFNVVFSKVYRLSWPVCKQVIHYLHVEGVGVWLELAEIYRT